VVAHPERRAQRVLQRLVGAARWPIEIVPDLDALAAAVDADAIAIVDAALARTLPEIRDRPARAWIAVPGEGTAAAEPAAIDALLQAGWTHVVAQPMPLLAEELLATVQKLVRGDAFGLEKYLAWGADVRSFALEDTGDREAAVAALAADVVAAGLPDRAGSLASVIADELLTNAFLFGANMQESDLSGAFLLGADLSEADLFGASLRNAEAFGAELRRANLSVADLSGADLSEAVLSSANVNGANFAGARLTDAQLDGVDLDRASGVDLAGGDTDEA
jgi:hypothetical protein